jgi:sec-independent protein translocase protein TatA
MIGGLGIQELLIVFIIALVLFGGKKLPEVGQNLGKALRSFKAAEEEVRRDLKEAVKEPPAGEEKADKTGSKDEKKPDEQARRKTGSEETADDSPKNG